MAHIFLSHSHKDKAAMCRLRDALCDAGFAIWTDEKLRPGTRMWTQAIQDALDSAGAMIVLLSEHTPGAEWVRIEINYAMQRGVYTLPLLISGEESAVKPIELTLVQHIDFRNDFEGKMAALISALAAHLNTPGTQPAPEPLPVQPLVLPPEYSWDRRRLFWTQLLARAQAAGHDIFSNLSPTDENRLCVWLDYKWLALVLSITKNTAAIACNMYRHLSFRGDHWLRQTGFHVQAYEALYDQRDAIEAELGGNIQWDQGRHKIIFQMTGEIWIGDRQLGYDEFSAWPVLQEAMIDTTVRWYNSLFPRVQAINPQ